MALEKHRSLPSRHSFDACSLIIITKIILDLTQVICPSIVQLEGNAAAYHSATEAAWLCM